MTEQPQDDDVIELKCWTTSFQALKDGSKRFEYRKDDRPYDVGKTVKQNEWNPDTDYTGDFLYHDITWIIRGGVFGIPEGYCIFSTTEPRTTRSRPAPASDEMAFKDSIIEQQKIHIKVLNEKMVEMMQGAAAQARDDVLEEILDHLEPYGLKSRGGIAQETIWTTGMLRAYIQSLRRSTTTAKERDTP